MPVTSGYKGYEWKPGRPERSLIDSARTWSHIRHCKMPSVMQTTQHGCTNNGSNGRCIFTLESRCLDAGRKIDY